MSGFFSHSLQVELALSQCGRQDFVPESVADIFCDSSRGAITIMAAAAAVTVYHRSTRLTFLGGEEGGLISNIFTNLFSLVAMMLGGNFGCE